MHSFRAKLQRLPRGDYRDTPATSRLAESLQEKAGADRTARRWKSHSETEGRASAGGAGAGKVSRYNSSAFRCSSSRLVTLLVALVYTDVTRWPAVYGSFTGDELLISPASN